jgi:prepilin-type N-terminal cleavage/methylation domain-containing protein
MRPKSNRHKRNGFTLIEMLLVAMLFPVVSLAIYSNFSAGARVWIKLSKQAPEEDIALFFRKASIDFENAFKYASISFEGDDERVAFASAIKTDIVLGGDLGIGEVAYYYNEDKKAIFKEEKNVSQLHTDKPGTVQWMLGDVTELNVSYFLRDELDGKFRWTQVWKPDEKTIPVAVRMEFTHSGQAFTKTFLIPAGG